MIDILIVLALLVAVTVVGTFLRYRQYVQRAGLSLWGIYLLVNLAFLLLIITAEAIITTLPPDKGAGLFENLLMVVNMGAVLLVFQKQRPATPSALLWAVFAFFAALWLWEFSSVYPQGVVTSIEAGVKTLYRLQATPVFTCVVMLALVAIYVNDLQKMPLVRYQAMPFFWVCMGWAAESVVSSTLYFGEILAAPDSVKYTLTIINGVGLLISSVCYGVAFVRSKNWVLQKQMY